MEVDAILRSLAEAIAWCEPRADAANPRESLRTPSFYASLLVVRNLPVRLKVPHPFGEEPAFFVEAGVRQRRRAMAAAPTPIGLRGGRLLVTDLGRSDSSGASAVASNGFLDDWDCPGWDTWVCMHPELSFAIVSWIPPDFMQLVEDGIWANPMDCIWWLDASDSALVNELRGCGVM